MKKQKQIELAEELLKWHHSDELLILPNAWNGGSARVFEKQGFKAVGTTSAGIAYSMGYTDGEIIDFPDLIRITEEITRVIEIPLSVDFERGYGNTIEEMKYNAKKIIKAGADCIFLPGALDETTIGKLVGEIKFPINIVANPVMNDIDRLNELGINRLSIGSGAVRAVYANLIEISDDLYNNKSLQKMLKHGFSYDRANKFFEKGI